MFSAWTPEIKPWGHWKMGGANGRWEGPMDQVKMEGPMDQVNPRVRSLTWNTISSQQCTDRRVNITVSSSEGGDHFREVKPQDQLHKIHLALTVLTQEAICCYLDKS